MDFVIKHDDLLHVSEHSNKGNFWCFSLLVGWALGGTVEENLYKILNLSVKLKTAQLDVCSEDFGKCMHNI